MLITWISNNIKPCKEIIDIGCGNGHICHELNKKGFSNITGVDYSATAIELCRKISSKSNQINFQTCDILSTCAEFFLKFGLAIDKGTFDAISLYDKNNLIENTSPILKYVNEVFSILQEDGILIINSCNWTFDELLNIFKESNCN